MKCDEINLKGTFGIELESIRVAEDGHISKKEHPFNDAHISKDFAECQMELITDTFGSIYEVYSELKKMYRKVEGVLSESDVTREYIWPFSVPPVLVPGESINIAKFEKKDYYREHYRKLLAEKYDKKKMLYCGIHYNYSFAEEYNIQNKNQRYLKLAAKVAEYAWLPVYLMGASPLHDISLTSSDKYGVTVSGEEASIRCGKHGYWNHFTPVIDYTSFDGYINSIDNMVKEGLLYSESELYYPVRLKCRGQYSLDNLRISGAEYIEFRLLDINPLTPYGVFEEDLIFLHMLFVYLDSVDNKDFGEKAQKKALDKVKLAAQYDNTELAPEAKEVLESMKEYFSKITDERYMDALNYQYDKINDESKMYSRIIVGECFGEYAGNMNAYGIALMKKNAYAIEQEFGL
mgnify:FL=1